MAFSFSTLSDPCKDRTVSVEDCPPLANQPLQDDQLFSKSPVDWMLLRDFQKAEGILTKAQCFKILNLTIKALNNEPNMVKLEEPITIVGDIHGQYHDLLHLLQKSGDPAEDNNYLFMGDYVDRGIYGVQTCLLLFALKLNHPKNF